MFWCFGLKTCEILAPPPGIEPIPHALEDSLNHWTTREVAIPYSLFFFPHPLLFIDNPASPFCIHTAVVIYAYDSCTSRSPRFGSVISTRDRQNWITTQTLRILEHSSWVSGYFSSSTRGSNHSVNQQLEGGKIKDPKLREGESESLLTSGSESLPSYTLPRHISVSCIT